MAMLSELNSGIDPEKIWLKKMLMLVILVSFILIFLTNYHSRQYFYSLQENIEYQMIVERLNATISEQNTQIKELSQWHPSDINSPMPASANPEQIINVEI